MKRSKGMQLGAMLAAILLLITTFVPAVGAEQKKEAAKIPAEIVSEKVIEERTLENGMKVAKIQQTVRVKKTDVEKALDEETRKKLQKKLDELPEVLEYDITVVKEGVGSISYGNELYKTLACIDSTPVSPSDPVNLVFYNKGSAWNVQYDMKNWITYKWSDASGCNLMAYIDDTSHGGSAYWKVQDYQLGYGDYYSTRYHIRIFGGGRDTHSPGYGDWSIAGVHYERWTGTGHEVLSWEDAENFVANDFKGKWFVAQVYWVYIYNDRYYQNKWNDGYAAHIEFTA